MPAVAIATVVALAIAGCGGGTTTVVKTVTTDVPPSCGPRKSAALRITLIPAGPSREVPYRMERCSHTQSFDVGRLE